MMSSKGRYEDASTLLLLVPFIASGLYGLYLWATTGFSSILPTSVYLTVTRDPYLFLLSTLAVFVGVMLDLRGTDRPARRDRLSWLGAYLQKTAAACFVLSLLMAWYSSGFVDVSGAAEDFLVGRYSLVFPALLFLFSYLVNPSLKLGGAASLRFAGFIAMLAVPAVVYEVGKRDTVVGLSCALILIVLGLFLLLRPGPRPSGEASKG